ncbi:MAG: hypothetical protein GXY44_10410 [Phycisphaerales bacterium]|nr:hypothetical protein [Phycisphaerales bacterium]
MGRKKLFSALITVLLAVGVITGCGGGSKLYRQGRDLQSAGNYDEAVAHYRKALEKEPRSSRYFDALAEAEELAAEAHIEHARKLLEERKPGQAKAELAVALEQMPAHPEAVAMMRTAEQRTAQCEELLAQARQALREKTWVEALRRTGEAREIDTAHPEVVEIEREARAGVVAERLAVAEQALENNDWETVLATCGEIKAVDPSNTRAVEIEQEAGRRIEALKLHESARPLMDQQDNLAAFRMLRQARQLWPDNAAITEDYERVQQSAIDQYTVQVGTLVEEGRFARAVAVLDEAEALWPQQEVLAARRQEVLRMWALSVQSEYERYADDGRWELAWPIAVQALAMAGPQDMQAVEASRRAEQALRDKIAYNLSVLPLRSDSVSMENRIEVCHILTEALNRSKPKHIQLLERTGLAAVLDEHDLSLANITEPGKLRALGGRLEGADVLLLVEVTARESNDRRTDTQATGKYVAGTKWTPNPDYAVAEEELAVAKKAYDQARQRAQMTQVFQDAMGGPGPRSDADFLRNALSGMFGSKVQQAADNYRSALSKRDSTPQRLQVDDWQEFNYPVYRVERRVRVTVRMRLVETATGRILWGNNGTIGEAVSADTQIEPDRMRGVTGKVAQLRDPAELAAEAIEGLRSELADRAMEMLAQQALSYWRNAQKSTGEAATADYVRFLFECPANPGLAALSSALEQIFGPRVNGRLIEQCKQTALERLALGVDQEAAGLRSAVVVESEPPAPVAPISVPPTEVAPVELPPAVVERADDVDDLIRAGLLDPAEVPAPPAGGTAVPPPPAQPVQAAPETPPTAEPAPPIDRRVFEGAVSRKDSRYAREIETIDGIVIRLKSTDDKPDRADIEIRVGKAKKEYKDLRPGARINGRGLSRRAYQLVILEVNDKTRTVAFAIETTE